MPYSPYNYRLIGTSGGPKPMVLSEFLHSLALDNQRSLPLGLLSEQLWQQQSGTPATTMQRDRSDSLDEPNSYRRPGNRNRLPDASVSSRLQMQDVPFGSALDAVERSQTPTSEIAFEANAEPRPPQQSR